MHSRDHLTKAIGATTIAMLAFAPLAIATLAYFDVSRGAHPHDVAAAPSAGGPVYYTAQMTGKLGILDPKTGKFEEIALGSRLRAARRDRRPRRRGVDHRRRSERDRARRRQDPCREGLAAAQGHAERQPQHAHLRPQGPRLVYRAERLLRPARSGDGRHEGVERAARQRPVRHHDHALGRRLLRVARRQPHRAHRRRNAAPLR